MGATGFVPRHGHASLRSGRVSLPGHVYLVTTVTEQRQRFFSEFATARAAIRALQGPALKDSRILTWVLMPDHLHALVQLGECDHLSGLMDRLKSASGRAVNRHLLRSGPVWQRAFHDHLLRAEEDLAAVSRYVIANPVRAKLVETIGGYPHWDAGWV